MTLFTSSKGSNKCRNNLQERITIIKDDKPENEDDDKQEDSLEEVYNLGLLVEPLKAEVKAMAAAVDADVIKTIYI